jgi:beta-lactamase superfamily II metal-dependent hydrolase
VRLRDGHRVRTLVVDGGGPAHGGRLLAYLLRNGITVVDLLVATHVDRNHIAGLLQIAESDRVKVENFWGPSCESTQPSVGGHPLPDQRAYQRLYSRLYGRLGTERMFSPVRGSPVPALFSEAVLTVLNPGAPNVLPVPPKDAPAPEAPAFVRDQNERALVLHVEAHGIRLLLGSDAPGSFWTAALADPVLQRHPDVHILKVPNYGRATGLPPAAASVLHTEYAVFSISAKADKQPSPEVISLCSEMRAELLCTEHAPENSFCTNPHCHAASGGQNIVFCKCHGESSYSTGAYHCILPSERR